MYFFEGTAPGSTSDEYEVRGALDVGAVIDWADADRRPYVLYARVDCDGLGLLKLAGSDPNEVVDDA